MFGGTAAAAHAWIQERRAEDPDLLFASDLERGAGQQFQGLTSLPPAAALAHLDDPDVAWRAGNVTGREAAAAGIDLVFAPVADLDVEQANPIVGTRSFGSSPERAGRLVAAWIDGCQAAGVAACPKHFPGHGRTRGDSHLHLPVVGADRETLLRDMEPFRAAIAAGTAAVMMAHVAYTAFDADAPASRSAPIIETLLRSRLGFQGAVVTDALDMGGAVDEATDDPAVLSLLAGCDLLLMPRDPLAAARALDAAVQRDAAGGQRLRAALARRSRLVRARPADSPPPVPEADDERWAAKIARRSIVHLRGEEGRRSYGRLVIVDDDAGGPHPTPSRQPLEDELRRHGVLSNEGGATLVAVFAEPRAWKGRAGLSPESLSVCTREASSESATFVLFGHPRLADELPLAGHVWCAWGGERRMQVAAAQRLAGVSADSP